MSNERKVIPFKKPFKKQLISTTPNDVRAAATGTIAFILLLMVGFNFKMFDGSATEKADRTVSMQRGIASVPKVLEPQWKKSLSDLGEKEIVSQNSRPSTIDDLTYGYLKGNYSFTVEKGTLKNIQFSKDSSAAPQVVSNRQKFISDYASALAPEMQSIVSSKRETVSGGYREVYSVKTATSTKTVEFQLDANNGLLGITVQ